MSLDAGDLTAREEIIAALKFRINRSKIRLIISRSFSRFANYKQSHLNTFKRQQNEFESYWQESGTEITLRSWIETYRDNIDPMYLRDDDDENDDDGDNLHPNLLEAIENSSDEWKAVWRKHSRRVQEQHFLAYLNETSAENPIDFDNFDYFDPSENDQPQSSNYHRLQCSQLKKVFERLCLVSKSYDSVQFAKIKFLTNSLNKTMPNQSIGFARKPFHTFFDLSSSDSDTTTASSCSTFFSMDSSVNSSESDASDKVQWTVDETTSTRQESRRKRQQRRRTNKKCQQDEAAIADDRNAVSTELRHFWLRRYLLFSLYDSGILLDDESWYSVTPEQVAKTIARRARGNGVIIDGFCGAGGNTIQFAMVCDKVIAIDIDPEKIRMAEHNATIYGVRHKIEFVVGDFTQLYRNYTGDGVFLSPPWGGPNYKKSRVYNMDNLLPVAASEIIKMAKQISPNISIYMPKNSDIMELAKLMSDNPTEFEFGDSPIEIQKHFMSGKMLALSAYSGSMASKWGVTVNQV